MPVSKRITGAAVAAALLTTTACVTDPNTGQRSISKAAIGGVVGAVGGYFAGDLVGGRRDRTERIVGAGIGAVAGGGIGAYMDKQERDLRRQTAGTGIEVDRQGNEIALTMPAGITFPINSYQIQPQFLPSLDQVAQTLAAYPSTFIDVYGHTDPSGGDAINVPLSQNRAQSVANYLASRGVTPARMATQGFGSSRPVADNGSEAGRAANRRVEIRIVPVESTATNG
jgi:outer membrane protein OmpA-like peptidoglycan-associated protein